MLLALTLKDAWYASLKKDSMVLVKAVSRVGSPFPNAAAQTDLCVLVGSHSRGSRWYGRAAHSSR